MKILIVAPFFPPQNVIASWRAYSWAKAWRENGHQVTVLTAEYFGDPVVEAALDLADVEVLRAGRGRAFRFFRKLLGKRTRKSHLAEGGHALPNKRLGLLGALRKWLMESGILASVRWPDPWGLWVSPALAMISERKFDVCVSTFGPVAALTVGASLKRSRQVKFLVADFRDLWTENSSYPGVFLFRFMERALERQVLNAADLITTVSDPLAGVLRQLAPNKLVSTVTNGFEAKSVSPIPAVLKECATIIYTGTVYLPHQSPRALFSVLRKHFSEWENKLQIRFYGPNTDELRSMVEEFGLSALVILNGIISREQSLAQQRQASALLFLESTETPGREGIVTGKIFEYLAVKRPILAVGVSNESIVGQLIAETTSGVCVRQDEALIEKFLVSVLNRDSAGVEPKGLPPRFERRQIALDFLSLIESEFEARKNATAK